MMSKAFEESYSKLKSMNIQDIKNALAEAERNFEKCTEPFTSQDIIKQQQETINRQKAEIERCENIIRLADKTIEKQSAKIKRLEQENFDRSLTVETWKWEAVKEFAERLKEKLHLNGAVMGSNCAIVNDVDIDNLVKEMVGETND